MLRKIALSLVLVISACGGPAATSPKTDPPPAVPQPVVPAVAGDTMTPMTTPVVIPAKDADYTFVNFFATWCTSSKMWLPVVERIHQKYGARLAVVGVGNVDESTQEVLTAFAREHGATFPVFPDPEHKVALALRPGGWGQAIAVVDRKGVIRFVHRGTSEEAFAHVEKAIGSLMAAQ